MGEDAKTTSRFSATISFEKEGKHFGHIVIPHTRNDSGWGSLMVPVVSIKNGVGPCVLFTAGSHGDEFEGQIVLRNIAREIDLAALHGHIIIVPALNLPAVQNASRVSPIDNGDMNRSFPGNEYGTITEKIASYVYSELVQRADAVIDLHAGGVHSNVIPLVFIHGAERLQSQEIFERTLGAAIAFSAPIVVIVEELDHNGLLDTEVEALGKVFLCAELGGHGAVTPGTLSIVSRGVRNLLSFFGVIDSDIDRGATDPEILVSKPGSFVMAQEDGLFEPMCELGDQIEVGSQIGRLHSISHPEREPLGHFAEAGGRLFARRVAVRTTFGDVLTCVGQPYTGQG